MIKKTEEQYSIADLWLSHTEKLWDKHWLKKVKELVNWVGFQVRIEKLCSPGEGRPAEDPVMLFRCLLLGLTGSWRKRWNSVLIFANSRG